jgi:hypothetical protein
MKQWQQSVFHSSSPSEQTIGEEMPISTEPVSRRKKLKDAVRFAMEGLEERRLFSAGDSVTFAKIEISNQTSDAGPTAAFDFIASVTVNEDASGTVIQSSTLTTPQEQQADLSESGSDASDWDITAQASTLLGLDEGITGGTYLVNVVDGNGNHTLTLNVPVNDEFPTAPGTITGFTALQSVDSTQSVNIAWSPLTGGTSSDYVQVQINSPTAVVYKSPNVGATGALTGASTSISIPSGTLTPGVTYTGFLIYTKISGAVDTTDYPGVDGYVQFGTNTQFTIQTLSDLSAPTGLSASQGTFPHHTTISWAAVSGAASYQVYRSTVDNFADANKLVGGVTGTTYTDTAAAPGVLHYYWIKPRAGTDMGPASASVSGYTELAAPGNLQIFNDPKHLALTWVAVTNATTYQIFRSETDDFSTATKIAVGITTSYFNDTTAVSRQPYFYWVRAKNAAGVGILAGPVTATIS